MAWYDDPVIVTAVAVVIIFAIGLVIYAMTRLGKKREPKKTQKTSIDSSQEYASSPFRITKSVPSTTATSAKDELRMLD